MLNKLNLDKYQAMSVIRGQQKLEIDFEMGAS